MHSIYEEGTFVETVRIYISQEEIERRCDKHMKIFMIIQKGNSDNLSNILEQERM